jgi:hypothetical protein
MHEHWVVGAEVQAWRSTLACTIVFGIGFHGWSLPVAAVLSAGAAWCVGDAVALVDDVGPCPCCEEEVYVSG